MKRFYIYAIVLALILFGSVIGFNKFKTHMIEKAIANMPTPIQPVVVETVDNKQWQPQITAIGFIESARGVELSVSVQGLVDRILFSSGDQVKKGQPLLNLDSYVEKAKLKQSKAMLSSLRNKYRRSLKLFKKNLESRENVDDAEANFMAMEAEIESLQEDIKRRDLVAPFDGIIGLSEVDPGQYLQGGDMVATLEDITAMRVRFTVEEKYLSKLTNGLLVNIKVDAWPDRVFVGKITAIDPLINKDSGTINIQAEIPNQDHLLRSGLFANVSVQLPVIENAIVIPERAVNFELYGTSVYLFHPAKGKKPAYVEKKMVKVEERRGDFVLLSSGLQLDDVVVTAGQVNLFNHAPVRIVKESFMNNTGPLPKD